MIIACSAKINRHIVHFVAGAAKHRRRLSVVAEECNGGV